MLPGKKYTPDDFLRIAWNRRWIILVPTVLAGLGTFAWSSSLPDRYRAQTLIQVIPQQVPQSYVQPTVTTDVSERLQTIRQQILSRTRLEAIMQEFNLYARERETMILEDVIERMRADVSLDIARSGGRRNESSSFTISYVSSQPRTAQLVTERLATLFVQENLEDRSLLADSTNQFLQAQLEDARRRLIEHEQKLADFRTKHAGRLPSQMQSNIQLMQTTQAQLQANSEAASRDLNRLAVLDMAIAEAAAAPLAVAAGDPATAAVVGTAAQQLEAARTELRNMELRLKPQHPDIGRAKRTILELEQKAELEAELQPLQEQVAGAPVLASGSSAAQTRLQGMHLEAEEIRRRVDTRRQEEKRLQQVIASLTARVEAAPGLESELTELMRDYTTIQESYASLSLKAEGSRMAANLERRQIGEHFRIIDTARLPERPFSPNRQRLNLMGLLGGFAFAIAIVALLEYRDTTFKNDHDIVVSLALPVIAIVPAMLSAAEAVQTKKRRWRLIALSVSLASVLILAAVVVWRLRLLDDWIR